MKCSEYTSKELNDTLMFVVNLLNENNIQNWFISYGTLLGIIRNNSCIDRDDDIDIIVHDIYYDKLKEILTKNNIQTTKDFGIGESKLIIKTNTTKDYCSIDFYTTNISQEGNFFDEWNNILWSKCYGTDNKLIEYVWNNHKLYLPFNSEEKLIKKYGETWRTPMHNFKGDVPFKTYLVL